ncbi:MAG: tRNA (adenosine(37)-N6)-threonylcarbamoyltransferase complex dimerization subunit type 1 TsaB [Pontixanthobacter sp.]
MGVLVIETATTACSVALFDDLNGAPIASDHVVIGRGHAERLIPMISALPERGRAQIIAVSIGPGSFTGLRIGIAAARALGVAWGSDVRGYPSLAIVAAQAFAEFPATPVTVCMNGGHGEYFMQNFDAANLPQDDAVSATLEDAIRLTQHDLVVGDRASALAQLCGPHTRALELLPDARFFPGIATPLLTDRIVPVYGRAPDAKLPR